MTNQGSFLFRPHLLFNSVSPWTQISGGEWWRTMAVSHRRKNSFSRDSSRYISRSKRGRSFGRTGLQFRERSVTCSSVPPPHCFRFSCSTWGWARSSVPSTLEVSHEQQPMVDEGSRALGLRVWSAGRPDLHHWGMDRADPTDPGHLRSGHSTQPLLRLPRVPVLAEVRTVENTSSGQGLTASAGRRSRRPAVRDSCRAVCEYYSHWWVVALQINIWRTRRNGKTVELVTAMWSFTFIHNWASVFNNAFCVGRFGLNNFNLGRSTQMPPLAMCFLPNRTATGSWGGRMAIRMKKGESPRINTIVLIDCAIFVMAVATCGMAYGFVRSIVDHIPK